jgi:alpha-galactosidase
MSAHVSASPNHQTGRITSFETRGNVAMGGAFGYELDLNKLSDEEKNEIKEQVEKYKKYYDLINKGDNYRVVSPYENGTYCAWEYVSEDKSKVIFTMVFNRAEPNQGIIIRLKGLDPNRTYVNTATGCKYKGSTLMNAGLNLTGWHRDLESHQMYFEAE